MKYKVGDKVRVKSREWYEANKDGKGHVNCSSVTFIDKMSYYCGRTLIVIDIHENSYNLGNSWDWTDDMLEDEATDVDNIKVRDVTNVPELDLRRFKIPEEKIKADLEKLNVRNYNVGNSDYSLHKIQPWDIWLEYGLNPWDADIVKRVLRKKDGESRKLDYEKIIHVCKECIRQIENNGN